MNDDNPYAAPNAELVRPESGEVTLAGRGKRLGGAIIDSIAVAVIYIPLLMLSGNWGIVRAGQETQTQGFLLWLVGITIFLTVNGVLLAQRGQTIGKLFVRTRIVSVDTDEQLPFWKVYGLRYLPLQVLNLLGVVGTLAAIIDGLFIFGTDKRCLHDHIARSKVVDVP